VAGYLPSLSSTFADFECYLRHTSLLDIDQVSEKIADHAAVAPFHCTDFHQKNMLAVQAVAVYVVGDCTYCYTPGLAIATGYDSC